MAISGVLITSFSAAVSAAILFRWWHVDRKNPPVDRKQVAIPIGLRTAALIVTDTAQLALMWPALGLGSWKTGFPDVLAANLTEAGMAVDVQILGGQTLGDWNSDKTRDAMAQYFGVPEVAVTATAPGFVRLHLRIRDTLALPAAVSELSACDVDLEAVPVGVTEDHGPWLVRVLYNHLLIAGATGSGKGSVLWSLICGLGPAIRSGLVDVWLADPKGGAEFGKGEDTLFVRFAADAESILAMLMEAEQIMRERLIQMRLAGRRKHIPTSDEPLIVVIIDEAASLSAYTTRDQQLEFGRLTGLLLSQGRAAAVSVVVALQDPSKEVMPNRQLFPTRIGLRLDEPNQTAMVHGWGARDRGARCDEIPEDTPGVAYVGEDGTTGFQRVRAFWVSDEEIDRIVDAYSPAQPQLPVVIDFPSFGPNDFGDEQEPRAA